MTKWVASFKRRGEKVMCIRREELDKKISEIRNLKALKEELEKELKSIEKEVIDFMVENKTSEIIGNDFKATYKEQQRVTLDKKALTEIFGADLEPYEKVSIFGVLRIA